MNEVYRVLDSIRDHFRNDGITKTVSYGELPIVDSDKTTIFPLTHFDLVNAVYDNNTITFNINVLALDIVNVNKNKETEDVFFGNNNLHDVYNTQFVVITKLINSLRSGSLNSVNIMLGEEPTAEPFENNFENMLAGWLVRVEVVVQNTVGSCDGC